jgi:AcrR family transcriptional regulator
MLQPEPTQPAERLSRERILDAALALVDRDGPSALSMRRIAQELDVWPMSLYRYFHDKDELLEALAETAVGEITQPDDLAELLRRARDAFERHPGATHLHRDRRLREAGLAALERAGLSHDDAVAAWDVAMAYAAGAAALGIPAKRFEFGLQSLIAGLRS